MDKRVETGTSDADKKNIVSVREEHSEAEIYLVRLIRKNIQDQEQTKQQAAFMATDYFDMVMVEHIPPSGRFSAMLGIWPDEQLNIEDVVVQSYTLYCDPKMLEKEMGYSTRRNCGDPFVGGDTELPFLSMIQIHITPEAVARGADDCGPEVFMDKVFDDILEIIKSYVDQHPLKEFCFRIYKMLSAGDFAVVIRSKEAEVSFDVSTRLRCRTLKAEESRKHRLVLYKTYTLLTLENKAITVEEARSEECFSLRCCYSNLYWSQRDRDEFFSGKQSEDMQEICGLTGRYDFSVRINEKQFLELFPWLKEYKETGGISKEKRDAFEEEIKNRHRVTIEDYLKHLMSKQYLSYINERYLVCFDQERWPQNCCQSESDIAVGTPVAQRADFLDRKVQWYYNRVNEAYRRIYPRIKTLQVFRRNMLFNMELLGKLIQLCYGINNFSDTRIYAAELLEQLDVVMDSIERYVAFWDESQNKDLILNLLEDYIRESLCALDEYARYIRNNNLQSLQTPNYNIQATTGMEKLLIGYGEYLRIFTEFYGKRQEEMDHAAAEKETVIWKKQYLPVVVPVLRREDMSVEVLFPEGAMEEWKQEQMVDISRDIEKTGKAGCKRYCMVISIPLLAELAEVQKTTTALIHEVAHQYRYEPRRQRNDALLIHGVNRIMDQIASKLVDREKGNSNGYQWKYDVVKKLKECMAKAYLSVNYIDKMDKETLVYSFRDAPLRNFTDCLKRDFSKNLSTAGDEKELVAVAGEYIRQMAYWYRSEKSGCPDLLNRFDLVLKEIIKKSDDFLPERLVHYAFAIAWECGCQVQKQEQMEKIDGAELNQWISDEEEKAYENLWKERFGSDDHELEKVWDRFFHFSCWVYENIGNGQKSANFQSQQREKFLKQAYELCCEFWNGEKRADRGRQITEMDDYSMEIVGRRLGLDYQTQQNFQIFAQEMRTVLDTYLEQELEWLDWDISEYREETADMVMCSAMELTPFGYLNVAAGICPETNQLREAYGRRFLNVILFQWCLENNSLSKERFQEKSTEVVKMAIRTTISAAESALDILLHEVTDDIVHLKETVRQAVEGFRQDAGSGDICWIGHDEIQMVAFMKMVDGFSQGFMGLSQSLGDQKLDRRFQKEAETIQSCGAVLRILSMLIDSSEDMICHHNENPELRDDYIRGVNNLKSLNEEMRNAKEERIQRVGYFAQQVGCLQNQPYQLLGRAGAEDRAIMNENSIDLLLGMYDGNKRRMAEEILKWEGRE